MPGVFDRSRKKALVRNISSNFNRALSTFFGDREPMVDVAKMQHKGYVDALRSCGVEVEILEELTGHPDCCFVEDTAIIFDDVAVICRPGHPSRADEVHTISERLREDFEIKMLSHEAKIDGGDVVFTGNEFLIGRSTRTNDIGINELSEFASTHGYATQVIDVPNSTLHLTTVCSVPRNGILIAAEGHLKPEQISGFQDIIWIPNNETYASNTIAMENGVVLVSAGFPVTKQRLEEVGFETKEVEMGEIMQVDGSLTCLSLFIG
jgi:dimethylargininase